MNYLKAYTKFLKRFLKVKRRLKVVFDCSNGTTSLVLKELFKVNTPIQAKLINQKPDPNFPAHGPNPLEAGAESDLKRVVKKEQADLGVIFDADGDRVFFIDDKGREIRHEATALLFLTGLKGTMVLTPLSGFLVREEAKKRGMKIIESRVGHYFIKKLMIKHKAVFAGEISGHFYFRDNFYSDSGILASIKMMNEVSSFPARSGSAFGGKSKNLKVSDWVDTLPKYYRIPETNFKIADKDKAIKKVELYFRKSASRISKLDGLKMEFGLSTGASTELSRKSSGQAKAWWFNLRPSNTEDLLRLNLEAKDRKVFNQNLKVLKNLIN